MQSIVNSAELVCYDGEHSVVGNAEFAKIEELYASIPFGELAGDEFRPLFVVKDLLPRLKASIDAVFSEPSDENAKHVAVLTSEILDNGFLYFSAMSVISDYIKAARDPSFSLELIDIFGKKWTF